MSQKAGCSTSCFFYLGKIRYREIIGYFVKILVKTGKYDLK
jgi:hypothetical protein